MPTVATLASPRIVGTVDLVAHGAVRCSSGVLMATIAIGSVDSTRARAEGEDT